MPFIPLHVTSSYSFLNSAVDFDSLFSKLNELGYKCCGISDENTLFGYTHFNEYSLKNGISPLFGMDVRCGNNTLTLFARNEDGYKNLIQLSYIISKKIDDFQVSIEELQAFSNNLVCIISTGTSVIFQIPSQEEIARGLKKLDDIFKPNFFIGLESYSALYETKDEHATVLRVREFINKYPYKLIAFPHIKYIKTEDAIKLKILNSIRDQSHLDFEKEDKLNGDNYLKNPTELDYCYSKEEQNNTNIVQSLCSFTFQKTRGVLLKFDCDNAYEQLKNNSFEGLKRLKLDERKEYVDRLNYELDVINKMGYNDYFLIVAEYVNYAKNNDILVGPGRGSGAGSLVSYCLNITEVDPLKYDLLFERFLNSERISMPDIDVDFEDTKRDLVVEHLKNKYGVERVSNITTIQTFQAKASIRDIGRVYDLNNEDIDGIAKLLVDNKLDLRDSYRKIESFKRKVDSDKYFLKIVTLASYIEGYPRQRGMHAAGVVLNNEPISNGLPIVFDSSINGNVTQFEMGYLEKMGYLKMDVLGLTNLSTIHLILKLIKRDHDIDLAFNKIPVDDPEIYEIINKNMTMGIFQLESSGMNNAISKVKPTNINDIISILALFRPGPMGNIDTYADRKNKHYHIDYISNDMKNILESTYGIIIYQEQIMQIAQKMAGFSLGKADILRRAISKKKLSEIEKIKTEFIEGCIKKGYSAKVSQDTYNLIEKFASYGFNKSHSVSYAIITARMAYLKAKYPIEFYIGVLAGVAGSNDSKYKKYLDEIKERNIQISLPNINESGYLFTSLNNKLIIPFTCIKGLMSRTIEIILSERKTPFKDFFDFILRTYPYRIGNDQIEKLINSGCFDIFLTNRQAFLVKLPELLQRANLIVKSNGQSSLFNEPVNYDASIPEDEYAKISTEYELIGIMISDNPLKHKKDLVQDYILTTIKNINSEAMVSILCIIKDVKIITTKKDKKQMAFISVSDEDGDNLEVTVFPTQYTDYAGLIQKNNIVVLQGNIRKSPRGDSFIMNGIKKIEG
jgi:DNA polymerase-3 subunit alpha